MARQYINLGEIYGQVDAARANQANLDNNRMMQERQRRQFALEDEQLAETRRIKDIYRAAVTNKDGKPVLDEGRLISGLYSEAPEKALAQQESFTKRDAEDAKLQRENAKAELAQKVETSKYFRDRLAGVRSQEDYDAVMGEAAQMGAGFAKSAPREFNPQWAEQQLYTADDFIKKAENELTRGVTMRGQDISMRGQDLSRDTAIRGQNMSASTARRGQDLTKRGQDITLSNAAKRLEFDKAGGAAAVNAKSKVAPISQTALDSIDTAKLSLQTIIDHPGRGAATGMSAAFNPLTIPGTDRAGFNARLETFKAQTFVPMVSQLKGMGALSDAEGKKLTAAVGALDPNMPEDEFLSSANDIMTELETKKQRALGNNAYKPPAKPAKNSNVRSEADKILGL